MAFIDKFMNTKFPNKSVIIKDQFNKEIELDPRKKYDIIRDGKSMKIYGLNLKKGDQMV